MEIRSGILMILLRRSERCWLFSTDARAGSCLEPIKPLGSNFDTNAYTCHDRDRNLPVHNSPTVSYLSYS